MERYGDDGEKVNSASEGPMITIGMGAPGISLGGAVGQQTILAVDDELE